MAQNFQNHRRFVTIYHLVLAVSTLALLIGAFMNLYKAMGSGEGLYSASLIALIAVNLTIFFVFVRTFPLKAQDRAIIAEENLRHYIRTGKVLSDKLEVRQIIGLRFASDGEYDELAKKAIEQKLSENDIKKEIEEWKADNYRV